MGLYVSKSEEVGTFQFNCPGAPSDVIYVLSQPSAWMKIIDDVDERLDRIKMIKAGDANEALKINDKEATTTESGDTSKTSSEAVSNTVTNNTVTDINSVKLQDFHIEEKPGSRSSNCGPKYTFRNISYVHNRSFRFTLQLPRFCDWPNEDKMYIYVQVDNEFEFAWNEETNVTRVIRTVKNFEQSDQAILARWIPSFHLLKIGLVPQENTNIRKICKNLEIDKKKMKLEAEEKEKEKEGGENHTITTETVTVSASGVNNDKDQLESSKNASEGTVIGNPMVNSNAVAS